MAASIHHLQKAERTIAFTIRQSIDSAEIYESQRPGQAAMKIECSVDEARDYYSGLLKKGWKPLKGGR